MTPMARYRLLGWQQLPAVPDTTGRNPGNLTTVYSAPNNTLPRINVYEVYNWAVDSAPAGATAGIRLHGKRWSKVLCDSAGRWVEDAQRIAVMRQGDEIWFFWDIAIGGNSPLTS